MDIRIEPFFRASTRTWVSFLALALLSPLSPLPVGSARAAEPEAVTAAPPARSDAPAKAAPKAQADERVGMDITPSAGRWRDRLRAARRNVLETAAALDDLNARYARVLYETPDDSQELAKLTKMREGALARASAARAAIPSLIEQARADGVDDRSPKLFEEITLEQNE